MMYQVKVANSKKTKVETWLSDGSVLAQYTELRGNLEPHNKTAWLQNPKS